MDIIRRSIEGLLIVGAIWAVNYYTARLYDEDDVERSVYQSIAYLGVRGGSIIGARKIEKVRAQRSSGV